VLYSKVFFEGIARAHNFGLSHSEQSEVSSISHKTDTVGVLKDGDLFGVMSNWTKDL